MSSGVKPFQKYTQVSQTFQVQDSLEVHFGDKKGFYSNYDLHLKENKNDDLTKNWIIEKTENSIPFEENPFLEIVANLERSTYPLEITVDEKGIFIKAADHKKTVENWKSKTENLKEVYSNANVFMGQFMSALEDEESFYVNKLKEPFWNLLFFSPSYLDNGIKNTEKITWFIKGLDEVECEGSIQAERKDYGFESVFKSNFSLPENLILELNRKYGRVAKDYKVSLDIKMHYNSSKKFYFARSADFSISDIDTVLFKETCNIK